VVGCWRGVVICLERGADLHLAQLMPLPLTVSCISKIQIGFTFLVPAYPDTPRQRAVKQVCVRYRDNVDNTKLQHLLPNPYVLVAVSKGMQAVKLCTNNILQFLTGSAG